MLTKLYKPRAFDKEQGFTLIELLVVIVIIGILAAIALPIFLNQQKAAQAASVKLDVRNTVTGVQSALIKVPNATGFVVLHSGDTANYALIQSPLVHTAAVPVPAGKAAVNVVESKDNTTVIVDPTDAGDNALTATSDGSWTGYVVHSQNVKTGYWYEFNSTTGKYSDGTTTAGGNAGGTGGTGGGGTGGGNQPASYDCSYVGSDDLQGATASATNTWCDNKPLVMTDGQGNTSYTLIPHLTTNGPEAGNLYGVENSLQIDGPGNGGNFYVDMWAMYKYGEGDYRYCNLSSFTNVQGVKTNYRIETSNHCAATDSGHPLAALMIGLQNNNGSEIWYAVATGDVNNGKATPLS